MKALATCFLLLNLLLIDVAHADVDIGSTREDVIKEWGKPQGGVRSGATEELFYPHFVRVTLEDGKVTKIRNKAAMQGKAKASVPTGASTPAPATAKAEAASTAPAANPAPIPAPAAIAPARFAGVPKSTIVTDPKFRPRGTWGGESDGKTIGTDGKPLEDHQIYNNDCAYFRLRLDLGFGQAATAAEKERLYSLSTFYRAPDDAARQKAEESHQLRYKTKPDQEKWARYAQLRVALERGQNTYGAAIADINYKEQLRVKDRIKLDTAPNDEGRRLREQMKQGIAAMHQARTLLETEFAPLYEAGKRTQEAEHAKIAAAEVFAVTKDEPIRMFIYGSFERTPMLEGLAEASEGRVLMNAKPITIPAGAKVQVLQTLSTNAPAKGDRPVRQLDLSKVRIKDDRMTQHDGKALRNMTLEGWILSRHLETAN